MCTIMYNNDSYSIYAPHTTYLGMFYVSYFRLRIAQIAFCMMKM